MKKDNLNLTGKEYWRSLEQLSDTPEFHEFLDREFPEGVSELSGKMNRRKFITLMGASMALAGLTACRKPVEKIVPYVKSPEEIIPGTPQYYATTMPFGLSAYGMLVESHEGRPTKIEGNEKHPSSLGRANVFMQAAVLGLYDPDRSKNPVNNGVRKEWQDFVNYWKKLYSDIDSQKGNGFAILTESFVSPTLYRLKQEFLKKFPNAQWYVYEPVSQRNIFKGLNIATGSTFLPVYKIEKANVILTLDSDFIKTESENIVNSRGFVNGRKVNQKNDPMNRLYAVESSYSVTGGMADHRKRLPSLHIEMFLITLIEELKSQGLEIKGTDKVKRHDGFKFDQKWIHVLAKDLLSNKEKSLIIAGREQPASVHALVFAVNDALGNNGNTVVYHSPTDANLDSPTDLNELVKNLNSGNIKTLAIMGGNPVYNSPVDLKINEALLKAENTIHLSEYFDETSKLTGWHLPRAHFLESWSDARAIDGTASIVQPLIEPLFGAYSDIEILNLLISGDVVKSYDIVRETWNQILGGNDFEKNWKKVLHDGVLEGSNTKEIKPRLSAGSIKKYLSSVPSFYTELSSNNMEVVFRPSQAVFDGRFANNGWLQELPDTVTKLAWDNAALMSEHTAKSLGIKNNDLVELNYKGRNVNMPAWILPGQADFSISLSLGYGRQEAGRIGNGVGFNTYSLRSMSAPDIDSGLKLKKTGKIYPLANVQDHGSMEGRPLVREATLKDYKETGEFSPPLTKHPPLVSLWEEHKYDKGYQWGMVIDLNSCVGCNACTVACQSENNIPIVGKEQVIEGREMHWLRIDRYFAGEVEDPEMVYQPVACQHCEMAPCEQVCPVQATSHDKEGLNVMTYNRCIGTRYCSNNCPYKVRRFNYFNYTKDLPEIVQIGQNPNVTVRSRGVMEKCTYCLQRINQAKISSKRENRTLEDGEVVSACQQTCPTDAITFGNINDPESRVSKQKNNDRDYHLLEELNIKPRTSFLAKLRNPNPELENG